MLKMIIIKMRIVFLLTLVFFSSSMPAFFKHEDEEVVPHDAVKFINSAQKHWVASKSWVQFLTVRHAKSFMGTYLEESQTGHRSQKMARVEDFLKTVQYTPLSFDSRTKWPGCVHSVLTQSPCGGCWAWGATEALSDRLCIASKGSINVVLSPQDLINCDSAQSGCNGGYVNLAWTYLSTTGVTDINCSPLVYATQSCSPTCSSGNSKKLYKTSTVQSFTGTTAIKTEIMTNGPVESSLSVYQDFFSYSSGVYTYTWGAFVGGHSIKIVGWGYSTSNGVSYWICQNSWGTSWGNQGFFWIAFGQCGIDSVAYAGQAIVV
jgi:cathepsin B